jgi:hypothetical protein
MTSFGLGFTGRKTCGKDEAIKKKGEVLFFF